MNNEEANNVKYENTDLIIIIKKIFRYMFWADRSGTQCILY